MQERVVREIRTLRAMWRALETGSRQVLNGHGGGNPGHKPRMSLRATAPVLDPTAVRLKIFCPENRIRSTNLRNFGDGVWAHLVVLRNVECRRQSRHDI